jgi:hypothetical protein
MTDPNTDRVPPPEDADEGLIFSDICVKSLFDGPVNTMFVARKMRACSRRVLAAELIRERVADFHYALLDTA